MNLKFEGLNLVTEREFLQALNTKWHTGRGLIQLGLMNEPEPGKWEIPDSVLDVQLAGVSDNAIHVGERAKNMLEGMAAKNRAIRPLRLAFTGHYLRGFVDEWIETGRSPDGREISANRTLPAYLQHHVSEYLDQYTPFYPFVTDHGIAMEVGGDTAVTNAAKGFRFDFDFFRLLALRLFVVMLVSGWKERICKCRDSQCGRYFLVPSARKVYRSGTFCCHKHRQRTAAARCMRKTRENGEQVLIEAAAEWLKDRKSKAEWMRNKRLKRILAKNLIGVINRKCLGGYHKRVTLSWVTRHQREIEERRRAL